MRQLEYSALVRSLPDVFRAHCKVYLERYASRLELTEVATVHVVGPNFVIWHRCPPLSCSRSPPCISQPRGQSGSRAKLKADRRRLKFTSLLNRRRRFILPNMATGCSTTKLQEVYRAA